MAVYKNIDGTSRESFKIGTRGITLKTKFIEASEENGEKIKQLLVDDKAVITEDSMFIHRDLVSKFLVKNNGTECEFEYKYLGEDGKWKTDTVTLRTIDAPTQGGVTYLGDVNSATEDGIVTFADPSGQNIKDSGYKILADIANPSNIPDEKAVPTFGVVKDYVGRVEEPLKLRVAGSTAKIV